MDKKEKTENRKDIETVDVCDITYVHENIVRKVEENKPKDDRLTKLSNLFKIFADKTRVRILWVLDQSPMCVCDLSYALNMTQSAISHQLAVLKKNNLVVSRKEGRIVYYSLSDEHVQEIFEKGLEHILEEEK